MASKLSEYVRELQKAVPEPSMEPDLDDIDEKLDKQLRESLDLSRGAVRKAIIEQGQGTNSPSEGDLVYFHLSVKKEGGKTLETTRLEEEEMLKGERSVFRISPEYSFAQKGCQIPVPKGAAADSSLLLDMQLINWYGKGEVKAIGESGVIKRTVVGTESWEHPHPPFEVEVSVTARIPSSSGRQGEGAAFFSSPGSLRWELGSGAASRQLEEGICGMSKGERAFLSCPVDATSGTALVPLPQEPVHRVEYEVELLSMLQVRDLTGTGEVTKRRIKEGVGEFPIDCPLEDNAVRVHFRGYVPGSGEAFYDSRGPGGGAAPLEFDTGVDAVPEAVDMCVRLMTPGEVAVVQSTPRFAYEGRSDRPPDCPEGAEVAFEVELLSFEKTPSWHSMTAADKVTRAEQLRQQGNKTFRLGQLRMARQKYLKALKLLDNAFDANTEELIEALSAAKANCLTNLAFVSQREENFSECFSWCEKALSEAPDHAKALYRRGSAHAVLGRYAEAEQDLLHAKQADPSSAADIDRELARMRHRQRAAASKERKDLRSFFDRTN